MLQYCTYKKTQSVETVHTLPELGFCINQKLYEFLADIFGNLIHPFLTPNLSVSHADIQGAIDGRDT